MFYGFIVTLLSLSFLSALYAFEGRDNVDAKFVEEAALKHTTMLLGL